MPKFLEQKLKQEYGADSKIPYAVMNSLGYMKGPKETAKGRALEAKHKRDVKAGTASTSKPKKKGARKQQASGLDWRKHWGRNKVGK